MRTNHPFVHGILPALLFAIGFAAPQTSSAELVDKDTRDMIRVVQDADGHSNVRSAANLKAPVIGKVLSGGPVFVMPDAKSGFHEVFIDYAKDNRASYVHASRLKSITDWKAFGPGGRPGVVNHKGFEAVVKSVPFDASEHRVTRNSDGMIDVNGKSPWGQDGGMPQRVLQLEISLNGQKIDLPPEATDNLYEPSLDTLVLLTPDDPSRRAFLMMINGDGAGGYYVVWSFENGIYRGRAVMSP